MQVFVVFLILYKYRKRCIVYHFTFVLRNQNISYKTLNCLDFSRQSTRIPAAYRIRISLNISTSFRELSNFNPRLRNQMRKKNSHHTLKFSNAANSSGFNSLAFVLFASSFALRPYSDKHECSGVTFRCFSSRLCVSEVYVYAGITSATSSCTIRTIDTTRNGKQATISGIAFDRRMNPRSSARLRWTALSRRFFYGD